MPRLSTVVRNPGSLFEAGDRVRDTFDGFSGVVLKNITIPEWKDKKNNAWVAVKADADTARVWKAQNRPTYREYTYPADDPDLPMLTLEIVED